MNKTKVQRSFLLLGILPSFIAAVVLASIMAAMRITDINQQLNSSANATLAIAALNLQVPLQKAQQNDLQLIASAILEQPNVRAVSIRNKQHDIIAHAGPGMITKTQPFDEIQNLTHLKSPESIRFIKPIWSQQNTFNMSEKKAPHLLGWIDVEYSTNNIFIYRYQTIIASIAAIILAFIITALVGMAVAGRALRQLETVQEALKAIKNNKTISNITLADDSPLKGIADDIVFLGKELNTVRNDLERNIEQATDDLRETLETIEIQNIELDISRKEAIQASKVKSDFIARTSHEIRTPLNGIIGFTNLLLKTDLTQRQKEYLSTILYSSDNLLNIINDILDFSKIESGKLNLDSRHFNFIDMADETIAMLAPQAYDNNIEIILDAAPSIPYLLIGDPLRCKQILTNLISNAIKFTHKGFVQVKLYSEAINNQETRLNITVTDSGIGMRNEEQTLLFQPFSQIGDEQHNPKTGTGLGLVITKKLVESMNGEITVDSTLGRGSSFNVAITLKNAEAGAYDHEPQIIDKTIAYYSKNNLLENALIHQLQLGFTSITPFSQNHHSKENIDLIIIDFPVSETPQQINEFLQPFKLSQVPIIALATTASVNQLQGPALPVTWLEKPISSSNLYRQINYVLEGKPQKNRTEKIAEQYFNQSIKILAADDNPANLKLLCTLLEDMGVVTIAVENGEQAVEVAKSDVFDLIFMDVQMPEMSGIEATQLIRKSGPNQKTPIIALTAHAMENEQRQMMQAGMNEHLAKPLVEKQLIQSIQKWTGQTPHAITSTPLPRTKKTLNRSQVNHPVDIQQSLVLANHRTDLAKDMLCGLLNSLPEQKTQIAQLKQDNNIPELLALIHKIHGVCCYTEVPPLKQALSALETLLKHYSESLVSYDDEYEQVIIAIDQLLEWWQQHDIDVIFD